MLTIKVSQIYSEAALGCVAFCLVDMRYEGCCKAYVYNLSPIPLECLVETCLRQYYCKSQKILMKLKNEKRFSLAALATKRGNR